MLHRVTALCIIGFWLAMTALLVVREVFPEFTQLNAVPVSYVGQIVFQHEQTSVLRIDTPEKEIGFLHIQPKTLAGTGQRKLELYGSLRLTLPGGRPQPITWAAVLDLGGDFTLERIHLDLTTPAPIRRMDVVVDFIGKKASFGVKDGDHVVNETTFTLDEAGFGSLMARLGVDATMMRQLKASQNEIPKMEFGAQSSVVFISGQKLSTFLLSLKAGGQSVFEAQVSQLGQVLSAQAPLLGWKLTPPNPTR